MIARRILLLLLSTVPVMGAPAASAQEAANAPPGLSAVDQYLETIPDARGPKSVAGGRKPDLSAPGASRAAREVLGAAAVAALQRAGQDGRAAAALAASAAPAAARPDPSTQNAGAATTTGTGAPTPPAANGGADGRLAVVSRIATGSGDGMGGLFPLLIVLGAAAVGGGALRRRWSTPG